MARRSYTRERTISKLMENEVLLGHVAVVRGLHVGPI